MRVDLLVAGGGLAGTTLAWCARRAGLRVLLADEPREVSASRISAGMVNPVSGQRFARSWLAETLVPAAERHYREVEEDCGRRLYQTMPIWRVLDSVEEEQRYRVRRAEEPMRRYLGRSAPDGFEIIGGGLLDVPGYLACVEGRLRAEDGFRPERVEPAELEVSRQGARWRQVEAARVVFCEGWRGERNPFFRWVPFASAQGEILDLRPGGEAPEGIVHNGHWLVPAGANLCRVGATFDREHREEVGTRRGRIELERAARALLRQPYEVVGHRGAVRPIASDRRPIVGVHPDHPVLGIFNGLATKGAMLAPFLARMLVRYLMVGEPVLPDADVRRFIGFMR